MSYLEFAKRLRATNILSDPWVEGEPRFREEAVVLADFDRRALFRAAEDIGALYNEVCRICFQEPRLLDEFFGMTPFQKLMWLSSAPAWHGIARADVFCTDDGLKVCELNCDTPSGEAEAVLLGPIAREARPDLVDPNEGLFAHFCRMIAAVAGPRARQDLSIGIVYPTEMTDDLSMVELYRRGFEREGWRVTLGSPFNLSESRDGRATLFGRECDVLVRHYKTDWWGEREPIWDDAELVADSEPLAEALGVALRSHLSGRSVVINPFGAVLPQNKRAMALMWEEKQRFPAWAQQTIEHLVPPTRRLETTSLVEMKNDKDAWVLKSDYGCEGTEIVMGVDCDDEAWRLALEHARPGRWIAQRRFVPRIEASNGESVNYGVYLVAGEACGVLSRLQVGATDRFARMAPTLAEKPS